jgi:hypothetical protein
VIFLSLSKKNIRNAETVLQKLYAICYLSIHHFKSPKHVTGFLMKLEEKVKFSLSLINHHDLKPCDGVEVFLHIFIISALY